MDIFQQIDAEKQAIQEKQWGQFVSARPLYAKVFGTPDGRQLLAQMLEDSYFFSTTFTGSSLTYFREGERNKILKIAAHIPGLVGEVIADWCKIKEEQIRQREREEEEKARAWKMKHERQG